MLQNLIKKVLPQNTGEKPLYFEKRNICIHCGAEDSLIFIDRYGRQTKTDVHAFDHIKCSKCGETYSIIWKREGTSEKMYPSAIDLSIKRDFTNIATNEIETFIGLEKEKKLNG